VRSNHRAGPTSGAAGTTAHTPFLESASSFPVTGVARTYGVGKPKRQQKWCRGTRGAIAALRPAVPSEFCGANAIGFCCFVTRTCAWGLATEQAARGLSTQPPDSACWHNHLAASFFVFLNSLIHMDLCSGSSLPRGLAASWLGGEFAVAGDTDRNCVAKPAHGAAFVAALHVALGSRRISASAARLLALPVRRSVRRWHGPPPR